MNRAALLLFGVSASALAQLEVRIAQNGNVSESNNGGSVEMRAEAAGRQAEIAITAVNMGSKAVTILRTELLGRDDFALASTSTPNLKPAASYTFAVRYRASTAERLQALLVITFSNDQGDPSTFRLNLAGTAPALAVTYTLPANNNVRTLSTGDEIDFPDTPPGATVQTTVTIVNSGSGAAVVRDASVSGLPFEIAERPFLPAALAPLQSLRFVVRAAPAAPGVHGGNVRIDGPGEAFVLRVKVTSVAASLVYSLVSGNGAVTTLAPGSPIDFGNVPVGARSSMRLRAGNQTGLAIPVSQVSLTASAELQLSPPPALPWVVPARSEQELTLAFAPTRGDPSTGVLRVGADSFPVAGAGLSSPLGFSYATPQGEVKIEPSGTIALPPTALGNTGSTTLLIRNLTSQRLRIEHAGVNDAASAFRLAVAPPLPAEIPPQAVVAVPIEFAPATTGTLSGSLAIDAYLFTLRGVATAPERVPSFQIQGPEGILGALQQRPLSASLDAPFSLDLTGVLSLSVHAGRIAADPAVRFSTGGRTVAFRIPAGARRAEFPGGAQLVLMQTGSVASEIEVTATLQTAMRFDLLPPVPPVLRFQVPESAPALLSAAMTGTASGGYELQIAGLTTCRELRELRVRFTPTGRIAFTATEFTVDVRAASAAWFQTAGSVDYGGAFTISLPVHIGVTGADPKAALTPGDLIRSIQIEAVNALGNSNALTVHPQ